MKKKTISKVKKYMAWFTIDKYGSQLLMEVIVKLKEKVC